jgi:hypothetical protein
LEIYLQLTEFQFGVLHYSFLFHHLVLGQTSTYFELVFKFLRFLIMEYK